MIQTRDLTKYFQDFLAVDRVNLTVQTGEVLALLGPNGAGKTTTIRMLTTVLRPSSGSAIVAGFDTRQAAEQVRASVGVLTEEHGLYDRMQMLEYLDFYGQIYSIEGEQRQKRINYLISKFGLEDAKDRRIGKFSKGMRQKLSLARALLHEPPVLLLDEPTSAMDPASARLVRDAIKSLRSEDRSIIVCTHNLVEAEELADKIAIIRDGRIIASGSTRELKDQLLGPAEYVVQLAVRLDGKEIPAPVGVELLERGADWFKFSSSDSEVFNPRLLSSLQAGGFPVISLSETQRSLESVYLKAVSRSGRQGILNAS
jgi:ABC-2 type transport system ATP-binding protein